MYRLLDLYCGGGGCSKGYHDSYKFTITGVDIAPQPKYPYDFVQSDALEFVAKYGKEFDAVHASPPCQNYSSSTNTWKVKGNTYSDLVADTRDVLIKLGKPYVIENVVGAPLLNPIVLCGTMFNLCIYRHRLFESNFVILQPPHKEHTVPQTKMGRPPKHGEYMQVVGNFSGVSLARKVMEIDWLGQKELAQAIPPAYTRYISPFLVRAIKINQR